MAELPDLPLDDLRGPGPGLLVVGRMPGDLDGVDDGRERVAELVGEHGQELVLAPIRLPELVLDPPQLGDVRERGDEADHRAPRVRDRARAEQQAVALPIAAFEADLGAADRLAGEDPADPGRRRGLVVGAFRPGTGAEREGRVEGEADRVPAAEPPRGGPGADQRARAVADDDGVDRLLQDRARQPFRRRHLGQPPLVGEVGDDQADDVRLLVEPLAVRCTGTTTPSLRSSSASPRPSGRRAMTSSRTGREEVAM